MRFAILLVLLVPALQAAPTPASRKDDVKMPEDARKATAKGLAWLAGKQNADGSWSESRYPHNPAITSFVLLSFLSQGHLPDQGLYGKEIAKASRFLTSCAQPDGYLIGTRGGNMYSHGMATLALAELYGLTSDKDIKPVLKKAVDLIVTGQNKEGGWRYSPRATDSDISVTIMQVMALRAAKNGGIHVRKETFEKAIAYIKRCYNPSIGGFSYQPGQQPGFARTSAGVCILQLTGEYKAKEIGKAIDYLEKHFDGRGHFWYGHYYASHAMHQVGGKEWKTWYDRMLRRFLPMQRPDGTWPGDGDGGSVYTTSIAVIALSVPMNYLPIYQR